jgi:hypothetical protein
MSYSENEDVIPQHSIDDPEVTDAIFSQTGKAPFEDWIAFSVFRKLFLDLI